MFQPAVSVFYQLELLIIMLSLWKKKLIGFQCESNMVENKRLLSTEFKKKK